MKDRPLPPDVLADALQDVVHQQRGRLLAMKSVRPVGVLEARSAAGLCGAFSVRTGWCVLAAHHDGPHVTAEEP
jgi:hypothetical protein